jgi:ABC-type polysaccharide/polyol phosphate export permease
VLIPVKETLWGTLPVGFFGRLLAIALVIAQHIAALLRKRDSPISNFPTRWAAVRMIPDGVIAIIITIMVLELKVPHGADFKVLIPLWPVFMSYVLSFIYVGIYWNKPQYPSYPRRRRRG